MCGKLWEPPREDEACPEEMVQCDKCDLYATWRVETSPIALRVREFEQSGL